MNDEGALAVMDEKYYMAPFHRLGPDARCVRCGAGWEEWLHLKVVPRCEALAREQTMAVLTQHDKETRG